MKDIAVVGAGSWGTALSIVLADNGYRVKMWSRNSNQAQEINHQLTNKKYLPNIVLPHTIRASTSLDDVLENVDTILLVVPTKAMGEVLSLLSQKLKHPVTMVHASKGIEPDRLMRISELITEAIDEKKLRSVVVLSGPSHAEEVSLRHPTTVTVSSHDANACRYVQNLFINQYFRVYTNLDVIGVELGGALKNIIAIGAGISDGLGYGDNSKAALITRGLAEMTRLGEKMGAKPKTFSGLSGMGDLIVTCTSVHSRNWRAGHMLGKGMGLQEVLNEIGMVVEGVRTTKAGYQLSSKFQVDMPITKELYHVLFEGKNPKRAVDDLMARDRTHEFEDLHSPFCK